MPHATSSVGAHLATAVHNDASVAFEISSANRTRAGYWRIPSEARVLNVVPRMRHL
jgi:hypothetical protein